MTEAQRRTLNNLEKIMRIDPSQTPYDIRRAGRNLCVTYTEPVACTIVIFPSGALYFEEGPT